MDVHVTDTIRDIDEKEWNALAGHDYPECSHAWYRAVEDSGVEKMHYIFLKEKGKVLAGAGCFLFREVVYHMTLPLLEVQSPLGASGAFFSQTPEHTTILVKNLEEIRKRERAQALAIFCLKRDEFHFYQKQMKGFAEVPINDNTYIDLNFSDFEDYLSSLDGKARRSVRITLNKARKLNITPVFTNEFSKWGEVAHNLQKYTCEQYDDYRWLLPERFYDACEKNLKESAELLICFRDSIPLAFGFSINSPSVAQYKFAGIDPHYRDYQAYFLIYYEGIRKALERRQKRIYFGLTGYSFKEKIGCRRENLFGLVKMSNPVMNLALQAYSKFLKPPRRV